MRDHNNLKYTLVSTTKCKRKLLYKFFFDKNFSERKFNFSAWKKPVKKFTLLARFDLNFQKWYLKESEKKNYKKTYFVICFEDIFLGS